MSSSPASDYIRSQGMDPQTLTSLLGVSEDSAATIVKNILAEGVDLSTLAPRLAFSKEETVAQLQTLSGQDPQGQLYTKISNATETLRQPVLTVLPHWQSIASIGQQQVQSVDTNFSTLLGGTGFNLFTGDTASKLSIIKLDTHTKGNLLIDDANSIIQIHQTFVNSTADTLASIQKQCNGLPSYLAAAVVLEFDREEWMVSLFLPFRTPTPAPPQTPAPPETPAPPQGTKQGGSGLLELILEILRRYGWLLLLLAMAVAELLNLLNNWNNGLNNLGQKKRNLYPVNSMADDLAQESGLPLEIVEEIISKNPGLSKDEYKLLLEYYRRFHTIPYNVRAVFMGVDQNGKPRIFVITQGDLDHIREHPDALQGLTDAQLLEKVKELLQNPPDDQMNWTKRGFIDYYYHNVDINGNYYTIIVRVSTSNPGRIISVFEQH